jgi:hypothetical protein
MNWTKWITDLFAAGIGGLIGGTVGAYFKGYSEEKGKYLAVYENIAFLLAQERGKAYEQEKGKRLATHDDIENVLNEVRLITKETETIKAQIGSDLWTRQMVWNHKRDLYKQLLRTAETIKEIFIELATFQASEMRLKQAKNRLAAAVTDLNWQHSEATLFLSEESCDIVARYRLSQTSLQWNNEEACNASQYAAAQFVFELVKAGKKDLGIAL